MKQLLMIISILVIANAAAGKTPSKALFAEGKLNYAHYCSSCHGAEGQGGVGPALKGSKIVTGPVADQVDIVLHGKKHMKMPSWGVTELSDATLAKIVTYQRNAWGNNDKKRYGKNAGGVVTAKQFRRYRQAHDPVPIKEDVRT